MTIAAGPSHGLLSLETNRSVVLNKQERLCELASTR